MGHPDGNTKQILQYAKQKGTGDGTTEMYQQRCI